MKHISALFALLLSLVFTANAENQISDFRLDITSKLVPISGPDDVLLQQNNRDSRTGGHSSTDAEPIDVVEYQDCDDREGTTVDKGNDYRGPDSSATGQRDFNLFCNGGYNPFSFTGEDSWYFFDLMQPSMVFMNTCNAVTSYNSSLAILNVDLVTMAVNDDSEDCPFAPFTSSLECCLDPGRYFVVVDGSEFDAGEYQLQVCLAACPPVEPPLIQIHHMGGDTLRVDWAPVPGAIGYRIFAYPQDLPPLHLGDTCDEFFMLFPPFTSALLTSNKSISLHVRSVNSPAP